MHCPKCDKCSGDDWSQCPRNYTCPIEASPYYVKKNPFYTEEYSETLKDPTPLIDDKGLQPALNPPRPPPMKPPREESELTPIRDALINIIGKYAVPCEYYHDYYVMGGKIHDDCPSQEALLKIIQDNCRNLGDDIGAILDKLPK